MPFTCTRIKNTIPPNPFMSVDKLSVSSPQSSAGILGISANTNLHGWKIDPKVAVVFMVAFIVVVKLLDMLLA